MADYGFYMDIIDIPFRPQWTNQISRKRLHKTEDRYFEDYLQRYVILYSFSRKY